MSNANLFDLGAMGLVLVGAALFVGVVVWLTRD